MKKNKAFMIALLFLISFYSAVSMAADAKSCIKFKDSTVAEVCTGDVIRSRINSVIAETQAITGALVKIEPGVAEDGNAMSILTISTNNGPVRLTTRGFILVTPGKCINDSKSRDRVCLGESFKSERDARTYLVTGFAVSDKNPSELDGVVVVDISDKDLNERIMSSSEIFDSHAVAAGAKMIRHGYCDSEIPFLNSVGYGHLPSCAKNQAINKIKSACNTYCNGAGQLSANDLRSIDKSKCYVEPNLFPPHKKVCELSISAQCSCSK